MKKELTQDEIDHLEWIDYMEEEGSDALMMSRAKHLDDMPEFREHLESFSKNKNYEDGNA